MTDTKETKSQNQTAASDEDNLPSQDGDAAQPALDEDLLGDENTIDRLLMKEDFTDLEEIPGEENASQTTTDAAPEDEFDEFADDEDLLAQEPQTTSESSASDANGKSDDFLMADFDISGDEEPADPEAAENTAAPVDETPPPPEEQATATPDASEGVSREPDTSKELTELIGRVDTLHDAIDSLQAKVASQPEELEKLTREQKKSKKALEQSLQKTALLGKAALASAILALVAIGVMVAMFFSGQSDVEQLQEKIIAVEDDLSALVVNQKTGELQQLKKDFSRLSERLAGLGTQMSALQDKTTRDMQAGAAPNDAVQQGINDNSEQIAKANKQLSALKARIAKLERRKSSVRKTKASAAKSGWAVNLISFKQEWYAQRKSAELKKKGIPVEVLPVKIKGENWYRLRVAGFKTKNEASSYAVRVKKSHMQN